MSSIVISQLIPSDSLEELNLSALNSIKGGFSLGLSFADNDTDVYNSSSQTNTFKGRLNSSFAQSNASGNGRIDVRIGV